jgi:hypothetical protein
MSRDLVFKTEAEAVQKIHEIPQRNQSTEPAPVASPTLDSTGGDDSITQLSDSAGDPVLATQILSPMLRRTLEIKVVTDEESPGSPREPDSIRESADDAQMVPLDEVDQESSSTS